MAKFSRARRVCAMDDEFFSDDDEPAAAAAAAEHAPAAAAAEPAPADGELEVDYGDDDDDDDESAAAQPPTAAGADADAPRPTSPASPRSSKSTAIRLSRAGWWVTDEQVQTLCSAHGAVSGVRIEAHDLNGKSRGSVKALRAGCSPRPPPLPPLPPLLLRPAPAPLFFARMTTRQKAALYHRGRGCRSLRNSLAAPNRRPPPAHDMSKDQWVLSFWTHEERPCRPPSCHRPALPLPPPRADGRGTCPPPTASP